MASIVPDRIIKEFIDACKGDINETASYVSCNLGNIEVRINKFTGKVRAIYNDKVSKGEIISQKIPRKVLSSVDNELIIMFANDNARLSVSDKDIKYYEDMLSFEHIIEERD